MTPPPPTTHESILQDYYDTLWADPNRPTRRDKRDHGWHFGYHKPTDTKPAHALQNMNDYIGQLLTLTDHTGTTILDAGCGNGATTLHLATHHPTCTFIGLSLSHNELHLATHRQHTQNIPNTRFIQGSFHNTPFPPASFNAIYALESASHAEDKKALLTEMYRILKPHGTLLILDLIPRRHTPHALAKHSLLQETAATLPTLLTLLTEKGFTINTVDNLLHHKRVNTLEMIHHTLFYNTVTPHTTHPPGHRPRMEHVAFIPRLTLQLLAITYAHYGYYVIAAEKNQP
jgi:ubiquinone/menaquinone biosynthesis C-methylase UbiE